MLLALATASWIAHGQVDAPSALVMFDFGDGTVYWEEVLLGENRTGTNVTEVAAASLGLEVEKTSFDGEAFITDIGDRDPVFPAYFHLLLWNASSLDWEYATVGSSTLILADGDAIGWFLSADDPVWAESNFMGPWPGPKPLATPTHPFPAAAFRGNLANSGVTDSPVPTNPALGWRFDTGGAEIGASPAGAGGTVFQVTLFNGTYAINLDTGAEEWRAEEVSGLSTPALYREGGLFEPPDLIVGSRDGALYRLDGGSGEVVWRLVLQAETRFTGIASSPKVSKGRALVGVFNESGGAGGLVSVDVRNGTILWRTETSSVHMSSPAVQGGSVYVGLMGLFNESTLTWDPPYGLLSVHEENGTARWMFDTSGPVASSPAISEGVVYFTSRDGYLYAVSTEGSLVNRREIEPSTSSVALGGGLVYVAGGVLGTEGNVTALDPLAGLIPRWDFRPNGPVQSSLTFASGLLLFATNTEVGTVYALDAETRRVVWTYVPEPHQYILPTPAVIDGLVVIASDNGFVYALGPAEVPAFPTVPATTVSALIVVFAGILVAVAIVLYARRLRAS